MFCTRCSALHLIRNSSKSTLWCKTTVSWNGQRRLGSDSSTFSPSVVIHSAEKVLDVFHDYSHLPWWMVITLTTFTLRTIITLPLAVHQNKIIAKMELLKPTIKEYQEAVKHNVIVKCRRANLPVEEANRILMKEVN